MPNSDFLRRLRNEIIHHKEKRAEFVLRKLAFVAILFGVGSIELNAYKETTPFIPFLLPYIALAFDIFIFSEHYKVQRAGAFIRMYRYASDAERSWKKWFTNIESLSRFGLVWL